MASRQAAWLPEAGIMQRSVTSWLAGVARLLCARLYIDLWLTPQYTRNKVGESSATLDASRSALQDGTSRRHLIQVTCVTCGPFTVFVWILYYDNFMIRYGFLIQKQIYPQRMSNIL